MFAGIGGFRAGLTRAGGFQCVGHCEIDKYADASYHTIKKNFEAKHLRCIAEHEILAFTGNDNEGDFSSMWAIIMALLRTEWFSDIAASCVWYDDDGTEEDVLAQAWKVQKQSHFKKDTHISKAGG